MQVILGAIKGKSYSMAYKVNLLANPILRLTTSKSGTPTAGVEPFDRWWGWEIKAEASSSFGPY
jgi:hypothetical protein